MNSIRRFAMVCLLLAGVVWGADVNGKWTGSMVLDSGEQGTAAVSLKQDGATITGTAGPSEDAQFPITKGRIDGEQIVIEAHPGPAVLRFSMKIEGNKLVGDVFEDDQKIGTISLQRVSQ